MSIVDAQERERGLDPLSSFCVSAPAGSGKTELLIQRYLALLARVEAPEQVLAITFTRKAAAEMRERVVEALKAAAADEPCAGAHQQRTRELAVAALRSDAQRGWRLLDNLVRFNIRTIDGFCGSLTRQMPVLSEFGAQASPVNNADELYLEAVAELFQLADTDHPVAADLQALMLHFDNHWERLASLLQGLLARREQWLSLVGMHRSPERSEAALRATLQALIDGILERLRQALGPYLGELQDLQRFAASNTNSGATEGVVGVVIGAPDEQAAWRELRTFLLTQGGGWRKRFTVREGFPPAKGEHAARNEAMKQRLQALLDELTADDGAREALLEVVLLPELDADNSSWHLVLQLSHVLPVLAAQLLLVFQSHGLVDHSQVSQSALAALGEDEAPTDLALRLDYQLEHILLDEFQDTAINQFELVRRLTRGWAEHNASNPQAPRTFFIVGDGMQSIYGFRDANVGLFLQARDHGFNGVLPEYLELRSNFRSHEGVVDWVNQTFAQVFPARDDISRGEVSFSSARAIKPRHDDPAVTLDIFTGEGAREAEVEALCERVARALDADAHSSVAILGRSRPLLRGVMTRLRSKGIAFAAQDMHRLSSSAAVLDLFTLTRALANRADRVAWLGLLRGPCVGLTLADLLALSRGNRNDQDSENPEFDSKIDRSASSTSSRDRDLFACLADDTVLADLSDDGRQRAQHLREALQWAESRRDRSSLRAWLEQTWLKLGGPQALADPVLLDDAEQYLQVLERAELEGVGLDITWIAAQLEALYANASDPGARVQVMTLHKVKGLEFDHVFIPSLARSGASDARPLLVWDEYVDAKGLRGFLLAADDHSPAHTPGLYNFLVARQKRKALLENTRLLYVGATRAIRSLHLSAELKTDQKGQLKSPGQGTLLGTIWPAVRDMAEVLEVPKQSHETLRPQGRGHWRLKQLPMASAGAGSSIGPDDSAVNRPDAADNYLDRQIGTGVHWALEQLALRSPLPAAPRQEDIEAWRWALQGQGLAGERLEFALQRVVDDVARTLADSEGGRWILDAGHADAACELSLSRVGHDGQVRDIVIDRCFTDTERNERWIIDYKTSQPASGQSLSAFLQEEANRYREQLRGYRDALQALGAQQQRCALYFTALGQLLPVEF